MPRRRNRRRRPPKELPVLPARLDAGCGQGEDPGRQGQWHDLRHQLRRRNRRLHAPAPARLLQGAAASPDRELLVYLRLNAGESVTGRTWTVSQD